jgi:prevent-host-death family protein
MKKANVWTMQDARTCFSELVRKARAAPQKVTVRGKEAVWVVNPERFEVQPKPRPVGTMGDFIEGSKKYRGLFEGIEFDRRTTMCIGDTRRDIFDDDFLDE